MSADELRFLSDAIRNLSEKQDDAGDRISNMGHQLARIEQMLTVLPDLQRRLSDVEAIVQQAKGAKWTLGALMTGAAFLGGGVAAKLMAVFTTK